MMRRTVQDLGRDATGVSAVEFAVALPLMLLILLGGYAIAESIAISRKVTITTRALADLTSQYASMSSSDMANVMGAASEIIAPFAATPLSMRLTEITTDITGLHATVTWSSGSNMTPYVKNTTVTLPTAMYTPSTSYILSQVTYAYAPPVSYGVGKAVLLSDSIYMLPRVSNSVAYSGS